MFSAMANPKMTSVLLYRPPNPPRGRLGGGAKRAPNRKYYVISILGFAKVGISKMIPKLILLYKYPIWQPPLWGAWRGGGFLYKPPNPLWGGGRTNT